MQLLKRTPSHEDAAAQHAPRKPVILVVDDERRVRRLMTRALAPDEPILLEAGDGQEALERIEQYPVPIDLLVADIDMPVMDGQTLADLVHERFPATKVLFVSGVAHRLFETKDLLPEWAAYLNKPFTRESLCEAASLVLYGTTRAFGRRDAAVCGTA